jgi:hypothetical protein
MNGRYVKRGQPLTRPDNGHHEHVIRLLQGRLPSLQFHPDKRPQSEATRRTRCIRHCAATILNMRIHSPYPHRHPENFHSVIDRELIPPSPPVEAQTSTRAWDERSRQLREKDPALAALLPDKCPPSLHDHRLGEQLTRKKQLLTALRNSPNTSRDHRKESFRVANALAISEMRTAPPLPKPPRIRGMRTLAEARPKWQHATGL